MVGDDKWRENQGCLRVTQVVIACNRMFPLVEPPIAIVGRKFPLPSDGSLKHKAVDHPLAIQLKVTMLKQRLSVSSANAVTVQGRRIASEWKSSDYCSSL